MLKRKIVYTQELLYLAGENIKEMLQEDLTITAKSEKDWVTNIDKTTEEFLVTKLRNEFPESNFLTEEDTVATKGKNHLWIIDPIDGTTNLINQKKNFAISVGYYEDGEPRFGIIYDVIYDQMYVGIKDEGAFVNGAKVKNLNPNKTLDNTILFGDIYRPNFFKEDHKIMKERIATHRFLGSAALEICGVGLGHAGAYVFPKVSIWDIAAAVTFLKCVGGTWYFANEIEGFPLEDNKHLILACANENIQNELLTWL